MVTVFIVWMVLGQVYFENGSGFNGFSLPLSKVFYLYHLLVYLKLFEPKITSVAYLFPEPNISGKFVPLPLFYFYS